MPFEQRLHEAADLIEKRLQSLSQGLERNGVPQRLGQATAHALLGGGKRFRPFLVIESARLFDISHDQAIETAAAVELIHCYSLVHDDLPAMDNDLVRRSKPTVWAAYDDWTAILAGDGLQALAFELLAAPTCHADAQIRTKLITGLAIASGGAGMVGGQALDLEADKIANPARPDLAHIQQLQAMKTGALIRFSCEAGAILAGENASASDIAALRVFGDHIGYAFQIADDLLDVHGNPETMGKATAKDTHAGKATLVSILGLEAAQAKRDDVHEQALQSLDRFGAKADTLRAATDFVINRQR